MSGVDMSGVAQERRLKPWARSKVPVFFLFAFSYFIAVRLAEHLYGSLSVPSPFWFPDSVLLCALLLIRKEHWWIYLSATLPIRFAAGAPPGTPLWFLLTSAVNDLLKVLLAAWLLRRVLRRPVRLRTLQEFMVFLGVAAVAAPLMSALGGALARLALGNPLWSVGYRWFLGNALAQVVITPTFLYCLTISRASINLRLKEMALLYLGLGTVLYYAFLIPHATYSPLFVYAPLPFLIAGAVRLRPLGAAAALSLVAFVSMLSAVQGRGLFSGNSPAENVLSMQLFLLLVSVPLLSLAILIEERRGVENDLRRVQIGLKEAQRLAGMGSWEWYPKTGVVVWSEELYRIAGRDPKLRAPSFEEASRLFTAESRERLRQMIEEALRTGKSYQLDVEMMRPDGTTGWFIVRGEAQHEIGRIVCLRGTIQEITERKLAEQAISRANHRLLEAQEQERARIARELHDDIGQRLALLAIEFAEIQESTLDGSNEVVSRMDELRRQTTQIASDIQFLSHELHSSKLEYLGVTTAMKGFCREFGEQQKVEVDFKTNDVSSPVPPDISLCLFRVLQEALHNCAKHSGVRFYEVGLSGTSAVLELTVRDSGSGFDSEAAKKGRGLGLISMEERLKLLKGTFSIESKPGHGTTIRARIPLESGGNPANSSGIGRQMVES
jgi:signal transduction histidine kinase